MAQCRSHKTITAIQRFFDERADGWDRMISAEHPRRLEAIIQRLDIAPDARVLDVGCGTGVLYPILSKKVSSAAIVVAADLSSEMMRQTRRRIAAMPGQEARPATLLLQADVTNPPCRDAAFDWVLCNSCFPHFHHQQAAIDVMARMLRPGGMLVVCHTESRDAINALHRGIGDVVGGHELPDKNTFRKLLAQARLDLITLEDTRTMYLLLARKTAGYAGRRGQNV